MFTTARRESPCRWPSLLLVVTLVVAAGGALRLLGIRHGEPRWIFHPDVSKQAVVARAVHGGADDPLPFPKGDFKRRLYPYGTAVALGTALRWAEAAGVSAVREGDFPEHDRWLWSLRLRYFAAAVALLAAAAAVTLLFPALGFWPALVTGLLLAVEPLNVRFSHYGMNDAPLAGLLLLAWIITAPIAAGGRRGILCSLLGGVLLGAGFAVKYQALLGLLFPLVPALLLARSRGVRAGAVSLLLFGAAFLAGAALLSPLSVRHPLLFAREFLSFMHWQSNIMEGAGGSGAGIVKNGAWLLRFAVGSWLWVFMPPLLWALQRALKDKEEPPFRALLISGIAFVLLLPLLLAATRELMRPNDLLYIPPFLIVFSGLMIARGKNIRGFRSAIIAAAAGVMIVLFGATSLRDGLAFAREDTRLRAQRWCREELPPGSSIIRDTYVLPVAKEGVDEDRTRFLVDGKTARRIAAGEFDYVIASSLAHDRFLDPLSPFSRKELRERYRDLFEPLPVRARFEDRRLPFNHPTVTVYHSSPVEPD